MYSLLQCFGAKHASEEGWPHGEGWVSGVQKVGSHSSVTRNEVFVFLYLPFFISKMGEGNNTTYFFSLLR